MPSKPGPEGCGVSKSSSTLASLPLRVMAVGEECAPTHAKVRQALYLCNNSNHYLVIVTNSITESV